MTSRLIDRTQHLENGAQATNCLRTMKVVILVAESPQVVYLQQVCTSIAQSPHFGIYETVYLRTTD